MITIIIIITAEPPATLTDFFIAGYEIRRNLFKLKYVHVLYSYNRLNYEFKTKIV